VWLLLGDAVVLIAFAITGRRTHEEAAGLAAVGAILVTAAPFIGGWLVAAAALGALRRERTSTLASMATWTLLAWALAAPLAMVLRALVIGRASPLSFYVVASTVPLVMLLVWRAAFVLMEGRLVARPRVG
jgi:hypothetical protein